MLNCCILGKVCRYWKTKATIAEVRSSFVLTCCSGTFSKLCGGKGLERKLEGRHSVSANNREHITEDSVKILHYDSLFIQGSV